MSKKREITEIIFILLDVVITLSFLVVSIVMNVTMPKNISEYNNMEGLIGYLQHNPTVYLFAFVLPLIILLVLNVMFFILKAYYLSRKKKGKIGFLSKKDKAILENELMKGNDLK